MDYQEIFQKCIAFHGHECPGLAIGVRAAMEAKRILDIDFSQDEEVVCVTENDACGVDGIQVVLGCTVGKGNLIFRLTGKHAYTFYNRKSGKSVRLVQKKLPQMERNQKISHVLQAPFAEIFEEKTADYALPEEAKIFNSLDCALCGENTAEPYLRMQEGKIVCMDCFHEYRRR